MSPARGRSMTAAALWLTTLPLTLGCGDGGVHSVGEHLPSTQLGCPLAPGLFRELSITSSGQTRSYVLSVPTSYDPTRATPVVFGLHQRGSSGAQVRAQLGLESVAGEPAIHVYPNALVREWPDGSRIAGWQNGPVASDFSGLEDVTLVHDIITHLEQALCVDIDHRFAVGFGWGGELAAVLGCYADGFDAIVAVQANDPYYLPRLPEAPPCTGAVGAWIHHRRDTPEYPLRFGTDHRDFWLAQNACDPTSARPLQLADLTATDECSEYPCAGPETRFCSYEARPGADGPGDYFPRATQDFLARWRR